MAKIPREQTGGSRISNATKHWPLYQSIGSTFLSSTQWPEHSMDVDEVSEFSYV
jgi:hypothetical protein